MNEDQINIIIKYFEFINKSIDYHQKGQKYTKEHMAPTTDQVERGLGVIHGITETKGFFVEMCQELGITLP